IHKLKSSSVCVTILLIGCVSMMGDIVYEGSRGVIPDYLRMLGASAFMVGFISGFGDLIGYALRLVSGYLTDTKKAYWEFMFLGYGLIVAIPLLGIFKSWQIVALLIIIERVGKAIRAPARDAIMSFVSKGVGIGKAFGIHEFLDQVGAVLGPIIIAATMFFTMNNYFIAFTLMFFPYVILLIALFFIYAKLKRKVSKEEQKEKRLKKKFNKEFHYYTFAVTLNVLGLIPISLILYKASSMLQPINQQWIVPLLFALTQLIDAPSALISGVIYDNYGIKILALPFILSIFPPIFALGSISLETLVIACVIYGVILGMQESIYRAAVSHFAPIELRGTAYGIFNTVYGIGFIISGAIFGFFIDMLIPLEIIILYTVSLELSALTLLKKLK
ncbi:MAG: MFS transporter, partial [Candidatus Bathyarchaeia archaeon]